MRKILVQAFTMRKLSNTGTSIYSAQVVPMPLKSAEALPRLRVSGALVSRQPYEVAQIKALAFHHLSCGRGEFASLQGRIQGRNLVSHRVLLKSFCRSQCPHESVSLFFILEIVKDKLTNLCVR